MQKINVISVNNGVGLSRDYEILRAYYPAEYNFIDIYKGGVRKQADLNIFLEIVDNKYFELSKKNVLIPNPEWFGESWARYLHKFNAIFVKTHDSERIFSKLHKNVIFTGFASLDRYMPEITMRKMLFLHVAGKSETKGTPAVITAFEGNGLPIIIVGRGKWKSTKKNVRIVSYMEDTELQKLQNECLFHICTSQYEGFGHYLHEARSCAIVVTTDAPPMNEWAGMVKVGVKHWGQQNYGRLAYVDGAHLSRVAKALIETEAAKLRGIFQNGRASFIADQAAFATKINQAINNIIQ